MRPPILRLPGVDDLYQAVGKGTSPPSPSSRKCGGLSQTADDSDEDVYSRPLSTERHPARDNPESLWGGAPDILVKLARCCTPVPGDEIVGFVTRGTGVSVHRNDCNNIGSLMAHPERMSEVEWAPTKGSIFLVHIQVEALDRPGLLSDVTRVLSEHHVNILSATVNTSDGHLAISRFGFEMGDVTHLDRVLNSVRRIDAVYDVYRAMSGVELSKCGQVGQGCASFGFAHGQRAPGEHQLVEGHAAVFFENDELSR